MMYLACKHSQASAAFAKADCRFRGLATALRNRLQSASSFNLLRKASEGEEAATPGQPVAQARFWKFPSR